MGWFGSGKSDGSAAGSPENTSEKHPDLEHIGKQLDDAAVKERADSKLPRATNDQDAEAELQQWLATFQQESKETAPPQPPQAKLKLKPAFPSPPTAPSTTTSSATDRISASPTSPSSWLPSWLTSKDEKPSATATTPTDTSIRTLPTRITPPLSRLEQIDLDKIADTPRPTSLSCSQAFDYAQGCQFMRGQFINVYRYGETRSCSQLWSQFWRCMRSRSASDAQKQKIYDEIWLEREKRWRLPGVPNSEDVWEARTEKVQNPYPYLPPEDLD